MEEKCNQTLDTKKEEVTGRRVLSLISCHRGKVQEERSSLQESG